jgi:hypothetical protein
MRSLSNLSQWMGIHARDARSGGRATRISTMVLDTAVMRIGRRENKRPGSGISILNFLK